MKTSPLSSTPRVRTRSRKANPADSGEIAVEPFPLLEPAMDSYPNRETLLRILDAMHDELYVINGDGVCVYVNKACLRHYNVHPQEIIGQKLIDSVRNGYWFPGVGMISFQEKRIATYEIVTNTNQVLLVTATPLFNKDGTIEYIVENLRNVKKLLHEKIDIDESNKLFDKYYSYLNIEHPHVEETSIIVESESMKKAFANAKILASSTANALLTGPTGSGKNLLARFIHENGPEKAGPFITINCAAIPEQLFESEFFGYVHGAFSGASLKGKKGIVSLAEGGTLFLDEINSIPLYLQAKLLHFLEERVYAPLGSNKGCHSTCRILAATNQNILQLIQDKTFREDLYYRISVLELYIPGLSERHDDFAPLIDYFMNKFNKKMNTACSLEVEAVNWLKQRDWPGNVRELENCVERIVAMSQGARLGVEQVRSFLGSRRPEPHRVGCMVAQAFQPVPETNIPWTGTAEDLFAGMSLDEGLAFVERFYLQRAGAGSNSSYKVAAELGLNQNRAYRLMKKHGML